MKYFFFLILFLSFPFISSAKDPDLKFNKADDLIDYFESDDKKDIYYIYKTEIKDKETYLNSSELIDKRESDKVYFEIASTSQKFVKVYSGDNYLKLNNEWYQLEYSTTTKDKFFTDLNTLSDSNIIDDLVSYLKFNSVSADTFFGHSLEGEFHTGWQTNWTTARGLTTVTFLPSNAYPHVMAAVAHQASDGQKQIGRSVLSFDLSSISTDYCIDSASVFLKPKQIYDADNDNYDYNVLTGFVPDSPSTISNSDYNNFTDTKLSDSIDIGSTTAETYKEFPLNAIGLLYLDFAQNNLLGLREGHDIDNVAPNVQYYTHVRYYDYAEIGTTKDPYLLVEYSECEAPPAPDCDCCEMCDNCRPLFADTPIDEMVLLGLIFSSGAFLVISSQDE